MKRPERVAGRLPCPWAVGLPGWSANLGISPGRREAWSPALHKKDEGADWVEPHRPIPAAPRKAKTRNLGASVSLAKTQVCSIPARGKHPQARVEGERITWTGELAESVGSHRQPLDSSCPQPDFLPSSVYRTGKWNGPGCVHHWTRHRIAVQGENHVQQPALPYLKSRSSITETLAFLRNVGTSVSTDPAVLYLPKEAA